MELHTQGECRVSLNRQHQLPSSMPSDKHTLNEEHIITVILGSCSYGKCGNLTCVRGSPLGGQCWKETLQYNYSFYLAFENSFCDDYITEKLYNPLVYYMVPVVWGGESTELLYILYFYFFFSPHTYCIFLYFLYT